MFQQQYNNYTGGRGYGGGRGGRGGRGYGGRDDEWNEVKVKGNGRNKASNSGGDEQSKPKDKDTRPQQPTYGDKKKSYVCKDLFVNHMRVTKLPSKQEEFTKLFKTLVEKALAELRHSSAQSQEEKFETMSPLVKDVKGTILGLIVKEISKQMSEHAQLLTALHPVYTSLPKDETALGYGIVNELLWPGVVNQDKKSWLAGLKILRDLYKIDFTKKNYKGETALGSFLTALGSKYVPCNSKDYPNFEADVEEILRSIPLTLTKEQLEKAIRTLTGKFTKSSSQKFANLLKLVVIDQSSLEIAVKILLEALLRNNKKDNGRFRALDDSLSLLIAMLKEFSIQEDEYAKYLSSWPEGYKYAINGMTTTFLTTLAKKAIDTSITGSIVPETIGAIVGAVSAETANHALFINYVTSCLENEGQCGSVVSAIAHLLYWSNRSPTINNFLTDNIIKKICESNEISETSALRLTLENIFAVYVIGDVKKVKEFGLKFSDFGSKLPEVLKKLKGSSSQRALEAEESEEKVSSSPKKVSPPRSSKRAPASKPSTSSAKSTQLPTVSLGQVGNSFSALSALEEEKEEKEEVKVVAKTQKHKKDKSKSNPKTLDLLKLLDSTKFEKLTPKFINNENITSEMNGDEFISPDVDDWVYGLPKSDTKNLDLSELVLNLGYLLTFQVLNPNQEDLEEKLVLFEEILSKIYSEKAIKSALNSIKTSYNSMFQDAQDEFSECWTGDFDKDSAFKSFLIFIE